MNMKIVMAPFKKLVRDSKNSKCDNYIVKTFSTDPNS